MFGVVASLFEFAITQPTSATLRMKVVGNKLTGTITVTFNNTTSRFEVVFGPRSPQPYTGVDRRRDYYHGERKIYRQRSIPSPKQPEPRL
jgi:hypothetical protein